MNLNPRIESQAAVHAILVLGLSLGMIIDHCILPKEKLHYRPFELWTPPMSPNDRISLVRSRWAQAWMIGGTILCITYLSRVAQHIFKSQRIARPSLAPSDMHLMGFALASRSPVCTHVHMMWSRITSNIHDLIHTAFIYNLQLPKSALNVFQGSWLV